MRISREDLDLSAAVASGSQGTVYRVKGDHGLGLEALIYKEFAARTVVSGPALELLARFRSEGDEHDRRVLDRRTVWPAAAVVRDGRVCGYVMQAIPDSFMQTIVTMAGSEPIAREVQHLFVSDEIATRNLGEVATATERLVLAREMAFILGFLHKRNIVFGDLSYKNAVYTLRPTPMIMLLDCDAVRFRGQGAAVAQLDSPGWGAPEKGPQTIETDRYKLGLFVLRCLTPNVNAQNRDPARAAGVLDAAGMALLARSVSDLPAARPSGRDWVVYLDERIARAGGAPTRTRTARRPAAPPTLARPAPRAASPAASLPPFAPRRSSRRRAAAGLPSPAATAPARRAGQWVRPRRVSPGQVHNPRRRPQQLYVGVPRAGFQWSVSVILMVCVLIIIVMLLLYAALESLHAPPAPAPNRFVNPTSTTLPGSLPARPTAT